MTDNYDAADFFTENSNDERFSCMGLPEGKTCRECRHVDRCVKLFGCKPDNRSCDFFPRRFGETR